MKEPNTEQVSEIGLYIALPILALLAIACAVLTYVVIKLCRQKTEKALMDDSRSATLTDDSGEETHFLKNMPEGMWRFVLWQCVFFLTRLYKILYISSFYVCQITIVTQSGIANCYALVHV